MKDFKAWAKAAGMRAVKTMAQTAALHEVDWLLIASTAGLAAILSIGTSLAGLPEVTE